MLFVGVGVGTVSNPGHPAQALVERAVPDNNVNPTISLFSFSLLSFIAALTELELD
jgi:hypothetical protein